jgi:DNA-directed RNA polymerase subunit RPC12/RpoP
MFSVNLCDNEKSLTIRAVCFNEDIYPKLESNKTYELESFKVKKSFGDQTTSELVLDHETKITLAASQVQIEDCSYTISEILRGETGHKRFLNVKAKVVSLEEPCVVGTFPETKTKRTVCVGDMMGQMELILWREQADVICFKNGDVVSKFNGQLNLTTAFETSITVLDEEMTVARSAKRPLATCNVISTQASILAVKEFIATYSCLACRKPINFVDFDTNNALIACPTCSCMFLKTTLQPAHKCMVLLNNNQWFTAHTKVRFNSASTFKN